jgi:hypothetical protein
MQSRPVLSHPPSVRTSLNGVQDGDDIAASIDDEPRSAESACVVLDAFGAFPSAQKKIVVPAPAARSKFRRVTRLASPLEK